MKSDEVHISKSVRVREALHRADLKGKEGTIRARWGNPGHVALDEGRSELFSGTTS